MNDPMAPAAAPRVQPAIAARDLPPWILSIHAGPIPRPPRYTVA